MGYVKIDVGKMMELAVSAPLGVYGKIFGCRAACYSVRYIFLLKGDISHLTKVNGSAFTTLEIRATAVDTFYNKLPRNLELRIEQLISKKWRHFIILFTLDQNDRDSRNRKTPEP
jgi:hypothetical protein